MVVEKRHAGVMNRWKRQDRRYRRLARRVLLALPKGKLARVGRPDTVFGIHVNPDDRLATAGAIKELTEAISKSRGRRYYRLIMPAAVEHGIAAEGEGRCLRLLRYFDMTSGRMRVRIDVAVAK